MRICVKGVRGRSAPGPSCLLGGRSHCLMPVAQFDPFERLERPIMDAAGTDAAYKLWHQLGDERNHYLDGVEDELIGRANRAHPDA